MQCDSENSLKSLDIILGDIESENKQAISNLEIYSQSNQEDKESLNFLHQATEHVKRLKGVYTLLEMKGCQQMVADLLMILKRIPQMPSVARNRLLETLFTSLMRLMQYTNYINHKQTDLPELMLSAINELRASINAQLLPESFFFKANCNKRRIDHSLTLIISDESAAKSRHFRQMYQIGLIEVLRQTNLIGGLKMMRNSIQKLDKECQPPQSPNLWWITQTLLDNFIDGNLRLTPTRIKLFSRIDRQIRNVEINSQNFRNETKKEIQLLTKELLYITSIADNPEKPTQELLAHFELSDNTMTDALLRRQTSSFKGPSEEDFSSLAEALIEEIDLIESSLLMAKDNNYDNLDLEEIKQKVINLSNLLKILQVDEHLVRLAVAVDLLEKSLAQGKVLAKQDADILFSVLDNVKATLSHTDFTSHHDKSNDNRETLSPEKCEIRDATHKKVNQLIHEFTRFTDNNRRALLLKNIPSLLEETREGFERLRVKGTQKILADCAKFINQYLMRTPSQTSEDAINLFADTIGSLEFYLETLEFTSAPSPRILQFAENSRANLHRLMEQSKGATNL